MLKRFVPFASLEEECEVVGQLAATASSKLVGITVPAGRTRETWEVAPVTPHSRSLQLRPEHFVSEQSARRSGQVGRSA